MVDCDCRIEDFDAVVFGGRVGGLGMAARVGGAIAPNEPNPPRCRPKSGGREKNEANLARICLGPGGSRAGCAKSRTVNPADRRRSAERGEREDRADQAG